MRETENKSETENIERYRDQKWEIEKGFPALSIDGINEFQKRRASSVPQIVSERTYRCFSARDDFSVKVNTDLSGITDFGFELYRQLAPPESPENFFFSPYSIWTAFTLAYFGAGGETAAQLQRALRVDDQAATLGLWRALEAMYQRRQGINTFTVANRAFIHNNLPIRPCISELLKREVERVNFLETLPLVAHVNNFASASTKGRITEIVSPDDLRNALMVLVNAAYFKGTWQYFFSAKATRPREFYVTPGVPITTPMMKQTASLRYGEFDHIAARVLELPYADGAMSMVLLLPMEEGTQGFANMVSKLNQNNLRAVTLEKNLVKKNVDLLLPKFKLEQTVSESLIPALQNLGIRDIFDSRKVDLTGFGPLRNITVDKVIHKAFVEVNEEGTEAAAVTAAILVFKSASSSRDDLPVQFYCNRPFVFLIQDNETQNILFMGAFKRPQGSAQ
ncbi:serine proteinase inhibitor 8 [Penaeus vannamei]|uniref:Serine proteinase inhibitor 8 n=1 Tax=Penaeus vannamei TaxID=6689 RepID=A0A3R7QRU8_PENVA|nr:serine proteinase inhibitor 8 [Penaeus vannamei]